MTTRKKRMKRVAKMAPSAYEVRKAAMLEAARNPASAAMVHHRMVEEKGVSYTANGGRPTFNVRRDGRKKPTVSERSIMNLLLYGPPTRFGQPTRPPDRFCTHVRRDGSVCRAMAIRGHDKCRSHGGRGVLVQRLRQTYADYKPQRAQLAKASLNYLLRRGLVSQDMLRDVPAFRDAMDLSMNYVNFDDPRFEGWTVAQRRLFHEDCIRLAVAWVAAYEQIKVRSDWTLWTECVRRGEALGLGPGRGG